MEAIEIAKVVVNACIPLAVVWMGFIVKAALARQQQQWSRNDRLLAKRFDVYERIAEKLNQIFCFVQDRGEFEKLTPDQIVENKRECDRLMHIYRSIWSRDLFKSYTTYIDSAFQTFNEVGVGAKVRTISTEKKEAAKKRNGNWPDAFDGQITNERDSSHQKKYEDLVDKFMQDLQLHANKASSI